MRQCEQKDFGTGEQDIVNFNTWAGYSLICPDLKPGEGFILEGEPANNIQKNF